MYLKCTLRVNSSNVKERHVIKNVNEIIYVLLSQGPKNVLV